MKKMDLLQKSRIRNRINDDQRDTGYKLLLSKLLWDYTQSTFDLIDVVIPADYKERWNADTAQMIDRHGPLDPH